MAEGEAGKKGPLQIQTGLDDSMASWGCIQQRFTNIRPLGFGSGGLVYSAKDLHVPREVSLKRISLVDPTRWRQVFREVKILKRLKHDNIITLHEVLDSSGSDLDLNRSQQDVSNVKMIFFVQELMDTNLKYLIDSKQLTASHTKLLMFQLFRGLSYLHAANVLHRDLKPANLFVNCNTVLLKIGDFGTSRIVDPDYDHSGYLTANVGTSWYRSPEAVITPNAYTTATDVWSAGCIMAHCLLGSPLFTGRHDIELILHMIDTVNLAESDWSKVFKVLPNKLLKNHPLRARSPLRTKLLGVDDQAISMLECLLTFDPTSRCTAEEALSHAYFDVYSKVYKDQELPTPFHIEHEVDNIPTKDLQLLRVGEVSQDTDSVDNSIYGSMCTDQGDSVNDQHVGLSGDNERKSSSEASLQSTHTLEEIFQAPSHGSRSGGAGVRSREASPSMRNIVESKNARNKTHSPVVSRESQDKIDRRRNAENSQRRKPTSVATRKTTLFAPTRTNKLGSSALLAKPCRHSTSVTVPRATTQSNPIPQHGMMKCSSAQDVKKAQEGEDSDKEKDVAECSPSKLREDLELGITQIISKAQALAINVGHLKRRTDKNKKVYAEDTVMRTATEEEEILVVEIDDTENFKEFSQPSPKQLSPSTEVNTTSSPNRHLNQAPHRTDGAVADEPHLPKSHGAERDDNKEDYNKKRHLKAESQATTISRKLLLDKIESEKTRHETTLSSEEFDELYRLPTDHLALNRDLSNQRLKHRTLMTTRHQHHHHHYPYPRPHPHRHKQDLAECLVDDRHFHHAIEGACGGCERSPDNSDLSETDDLIQAILGDSVSIQTGSYGSPRTLNGVPANGGGGPAYDIDISLNVLPTAATITPSSMAGHPITSRDPLSSPESPPSPSGGRSGARPKKSPKKQRAL